MLKPQHFTPPEESKAQECAVPAEIAGDLLTAGVSLVVSIAAVVVVGDAALFPHAVSAPVRRTSMRMKKRLQDVFLIYAYCS